MAKQTVFVDDLTGEPGASPRLITFDGTTYEIDLTDANLQRMREAIREFLEAGRVVQAGRSPGRGAAKGGKRSTPVRKPTTVGPSPATIRAWADANGVACPRRGRIPASVSDAYALAMDMGRTSA